MPNRAQDLDLFTHGEDLAPDAPLIYLAMPLSFLPDAEAREQVEFQAYTVGRAIADTTRDRTDPWPVRVHSPLMWSAPWRKNDLTPQDVYELNTRMLWTEADALIVLGYRGGSLGAGQEFAWACGQHLPILYVHSANTPVSRQLEGAAHEHDVTVAPYASPSQLSDLVGQWLASRRHVISDGPRRRRSRAQRFIPLQMSLNRVWQELATEEQEHVVAVTGLAPGRISRIVSDPLTLSGSTTHELTSLCGALSVEATGGVLQQLPDLQPSQVAALRSAAAELDWDPDTTLDMYAQARAEIARGGVRRLVFSNIEDWATFYERMNGR